MKKNAALLRFLAFLLLDHIFGVLRVERLAAHNERRQADIKPVALFRALRYDTDNYHLITETHP